LGKNTVSSFLFAGASKEIREAITNPTPENEATAWEMVMPLVLKLKTFYDFSLKLEEIVPKILHALCVNPKHGQPIAG
jgi:CYRIA/CYRIB Rac1 binding domain